MAGACNPLTVDKSYDLDKVDPSVTLLPGATVDASALISDPIVLPIGQLLEGATGEGSFLKLAPDNDPIFDPGDLMFRQDANVAAINPKLACIYNPQPTDDPADKPVFDNPMAVFMVDVPGMLNVSNEYTLRNPCVGLRVVSDLLPTLGEGQSMSMDIVFRVAGTEHPVNGVPLANMADQTVFLSPKGGFASAANESDFLLADLSGWVSPLPFEFRIISLTLKPAGPAPAYAAGDKANFSLTPSFILPADFSRPSSFGSSLAFTGVKITPNSDKYKVGLYSISAHFEATSTLPFEIEIVGQPNDSVSITFPKINPGSVANPVRTEGDILLEYKSYSSISSLITDITATAPAGDDPHQLNSNQSISLAIKSVTLPEGVEIEFLK